MTRRERLLSIAFAVWGLAIGIALIAIWNQPTTPDQLPGTARAQGFDAHGPFRWIAGLMLLPILMPLVFRPLIRRLVHAPRSWPVNAIVITPVVTLWLVTIHRNVLWALIPCAIVIAVCTLLRDRDLQFTRRDVVLIAAFLPALLAITDIKPGLPVDAAIYIGALLILAAQRVKGAGVLCADARCQ